MEDIEANIKYYEVKRDTLFWKLKDNQSQFLWKIIKIKELLDQGELPAVKLDMSEKLDGLAPLITTLHEKFHNFSREEQKEEQTCDKLHMTFDMWRVTHNTRHMTCDMWHMTGLGAE